MRLATATVLFLLLWSATFAAGPVPPCAGPAIPVAGAVNAPPTIKVWPLGSLGESWIPPSCSGWSTPGFRSLIALTGRFQLHGGMDALLSRLGAVSQTVGIRYWSVTDKRWQALIREAQAVETVSGRPRGDFAPSEIAPGQTLSFRQIDNGSGSVDYRMYILSRTSDRIVLETENTSTVRFALLPLFHRGDLQSLYVIERQSGDTWLYYNLIRIGRDASWLTDGHDASSVNRAVAWFRHIAAIPTDQEPPAAP